ncbi:MAG: M1 family metallopeptidase [Reichenbachiella sp.]|uniref:M1 family metallopeptidase n=1 Tax=Reichenbachiella sp. TaxID=2184521 RepID=UPI003298FE57
MSKLLFRYFLISFLLCSHLLATGQRRTLEPFDVLHYQFDVSLNDTTDVVFVNAKVTVFYGQHVPKNTILDLANQSGRTGMKVKELTINNEKVSFEHQADQLKIQTLQSIQKGDTSEIYISYEGIPDNGLIISKNAHGDRVFFAEHWPNQAHRWLPVVDHPAEKATCEFIVTAPEKYQVVANGEFLSEKMLLSNSKKTTWQMSYPISTKVMVIGVAEFRTKTLDDKGRITAWIYKNSDDTILNDFSEAPAILESLEKLLGKYPFSKCDQVESTTRFGGMENAGNIFYPEKLLTGKQKLNKTIAHEIGHQWFGNAVTEKDWADIWISEGFATFLENYWIHETLGKEYLQPKLEKEELKILSYQKKNPEHTVVQQNIEDLNNLMNALTYDKAAWVLRMLRYKLGKETFRKIIFTFYERFKYGNASTQDFIDVANEISLLDLTKFFQQWFFTPGAPKVNYTWKYKKNKLIFEFEQLTDKMYHLDVDVQIKYQDMKFEIKHLELDKREQSIEIECDEPSSVRVDPLNIILGHFQKE